MIILRNKNFSLSGPFDWLVKFEKPWISLGIAERQGISEKDATKKIDELVDWLKGKKLLSKRGEEFLSSSAYDHRLSPFMVKNNKVVKGLDDLFTLTQPVHKDYVGKEWYEVDPSDFL